MTLSQYLLFLPACFALNLAFGPNNLLAVTNGSRHGVHTALRAGLGRIAAFAIMITISGIGMGSLLLASEVAFTAVKWLGAAYLLWLGLRLLRSPAPSTGPGPHAPVSSQLPAHRALARQEFTVAIGNPKAILIFTAFLPQFAVPAHYALSYAEVALSFLALEMVTITIYAWLGRRMTRMAERGHAMGWFNKLSGAMMVGFGVLLALARPPGV